MFNRIVMNIIKMIFEIFFSLNGVFAMLLLRKITMIFYPWDVVRGGVSGPGFRYAQSRLLATREFLSNV